MALRRPPESARSGRRRAGRHLFRWIAVRRFGWRNTRAGAYLAPDGRAGMQGAFIRESPYRVLLQIQLVLHVLSPGNHCIFADRKRPGFQKLYSGCEFRNGAGLRMGKTKNKNLCTTLRQAQGRPGAETRRKADSNHMAKKIRRAMVARLKSDAIRQPEPEVS